MDSLLARYFDGDLSEGEARELLDAAERNPDLERELRAYERLLSTACTLPTPQAPVHLTERLLDSLTAAPQRRPLAIPPSRFRPWWAGAALAASIAAVAFIGGWWAGRGQIAGQIATREMRMITGQAPYSTGLPAGTAAESGLRYVRLVYIPGAGDVQHVAVAGSFNNWDPDSTPLRRQNGVWSTILVLPWGSYEYMFVENGKRWVTDPLAARTRDDGFGAMNAVLDVEL